MALATQLDAWHAKLPDPAYEILNHGGFVLRHIPPTAIRLPLAVVHGRFPTLESDWVPALPMLVVDVFVGADTYGQLEDRVNEYLACGVPLVWVLTPSSKTVTVHRPNVPPVMVNDTQLLDGFAELPGFSCPVADLFR
jgi:Uma2 family endonuclease